MIASNDAISSRTTEGALVLVMGPCQCCDDQFCSGLYVYKFNCIQHRIKIKKILFRLFI